MRAVIQRVSRAEITIDHQETREIGQGLVVFLGVMKGDTEAQAEFLAEKAQGLRIFTDENGKMNLSLEDIGGEMLVVSNFTLGTDCKKGRGPPLTWQRPRRRRTGSTATCGAHPGTGIPKVETGRFGAHMDVLCANDGPVNIIIDTERIGK